MEMNIFMTGWKKNYKSTITMSRDTPEIRLKSHRKGRKLFIFIAANVTPSNSLYCTWYHSSFINMSYQHIMVLIKWIERHVFIPVGQAPSASFLSSNSQWDTIPNPNVSQICNIITAYSITIIPNIADGHRSIFVRFTHKSQQTTNGKL